LLYHSFSYMSIGYASFTPVYLSVTP
jgi:hypothetical protein